MYRDMVVRYFLAASPAEHFVMDTLMEDMAREGWIVFSDPMNNPDAEFIATTVVRQLSLRHDSRAPIRLRYTKIHTDFAIQAVETFKQLNLHIPIFLAAFERLWYEMVRTSQHSFGESWETILLYATLLFDASVWVFFGWPN